MPNTVSNTSVRVVQEKVTSEMDTLTDNISRTRSRIVQSPERIKRDIHSMGNSAAEEKRTVAANETKTRDLQAKIAALLNIERARLQCRVSPVCTIS